MNAFMYVYMYAYVCICVCFFIYTYVGFIYVRNIQTLCLKASMFEYSYVDYVVSHVHMEKKKKSSEKRTIWTTAACDSFVKLRKKFFTWSFQRFFKTAMLTRF